MASITMIKDITPTKRNAVLKIRSLVSWRQARNYKNKTPPTLEIILIDEEGDKIQASLQNKSIELYENVLTYGTTALISNFNVAANGATNKGTTGLATTHKFKIWFLPSTVVKVINNFVGPVHGFKFASFSNIQAKKDLKDEDVVDIIGCITKVGDIQSFENKKNGTQNVRVTTHLMDSRSVIINCTLFGELAKSLIDLISKQDPDRPIILIVQFGKIKEFSDEFTVTNRFEGTRIYVNDDIEEINDFLTSYDGESGVGKIEPATQSMSTIGPDFYLDCEHILLADITDSQEGKYVSLATIDSIHFEDGWFYSACKKHNKKVFPLNEVELMKVKNPGNGLKCPSCGHNPQSLFPKFMLNVRVVNDTGPASLKLMDRHVKEMLGMSAYDLRKKYLAYDDDVIPEELDDIIGKQYLFKIEVSQYNIEHKYYIYTVDALTDDGDTIAQFKNTYHIDDGVTDDNITVSTDVMSPTFVSSQDVVSATGDNYGVLDLTTSTTTDSPHGKRKHIDCDPASVNTSSTKLKRRNVKFTVEEDE